MWPVMWPLALLVVVMANMLSWAYGFIRRYVCGWSRQLHDLERSAELIL